MKDLTELIRDWPVEQAAVGVTDATTTLGIGGDPTWQLRIASVSKLLVGFAALVAIEEGAIELDEPAGPPGATVRHLLAHASGLAFDQDRLLAQPGARRIYSNVGIERFTEHLATRTGIVFQDYLHDAVLQPLGMSDTSLVGSPAHDIVSTVDDLLRFARELLRPTLVAPATLAEATTAQFPSLGGVLPSIGRFDPNPWGLTFELRDGKDPHWTGRRNSERTFGHFGATGTFLWVDPEAGLGCVALTGHEFGPWALAAWPRFSDAILADHAGLA
ncbi:MAG TPA: serine hydrolase domain-containing protein [Natronosporangium sp.]